MPTLEQQQQSVPFIETPHWREAYHAPKDHVATIQRQSVEISKWQALTETLATALADCKNRAMDKSIETHADDHAKGCVDDIWEWAESALAAYDAAKSGNETDFATKDPLAEAVKRMEAVPVEELDEAYGIIRCSRFMEAVRARLIEAAKGGQP